MVTVEFKQIALYLILVKILLRILRFSLSLDWRLFQKIYKFNPVTLIFTAGN